MHERAVKLLKFETELRHSIDRGELRVFYQPIVSLLSAMVVGSRRCSAGIAATSW